MPAVLVTGARLFITRSPHWLLSQGRLREAEQELTRLLAREPPYPKAVRIQCATDRAVTQRRGGFWLLFGRRHRRATLLASLPWFLQDLSTYGIGIFTPTILAATLGYANDYPRHVADIVLKDMLAAKGAALIDILLIIGILAAVLLADRIGRIRLQIIGFIGCALGLLLATLSLGMTGTAQTLLLFSGFMLFNFMTNLGPNAQTYLLAGEVFPTHIRAKGAGFAASFAKLGAAATAFLFPILLVDLGTQNLLLILIGTSLAGALVTWLLRIETAGRNLEELED